MNLQIKKILLQSKILDKIYFLVLEKGFQISLI